MSCFLLVLLVWVFSVCLHEFGHAYAALKGGDYTVREKGYLSMNPLNYLDPIGSFLIPMLCMVMGGIGLPGGAVYLRRDLLPSREWNIWVSLAGPAMNLVMAVVLAFLLEWVFIPYYYDHPVTYGLAFLLQLQICAILFNLLPIPPLDGYQAIEPWLPRRWAEAIAPLRGQGIWLIIMLFWFVKPVNIAFWGLVDHIVSFMGVPPQLGDRGLMNFQFWR